MFAITEQGGTHRGLAVRQSQVHVHHARKPLNGREKHWRQFWSPFDRQKLSPNTAKPAVAILEYDDISYPVPLEYLEIVKDELRTLGRDYAKQRLEDLRQVYAGGGRLTGQLMEGLSDEQHAELTMVFSMAMLNEIPRWPEKVEGIPSQAVSRH
ncbi:hypothetical protein GGQ64_005101 [Rhizobium azooxidifex]|uniref:Uncharacterized protein n=1 Tax=Mycoplana azooxidifex TaxID=1636188 RepID=A0A7W6DC71_9HYPH|nr:hypothetical protein [Mycoplana azooxidifex]MBB3979854.1 hypothetical protein [Mycoplana azooxidifex]